MKDEREDGESRASSFSLPTSSFAPKARIHIFWQKRIRQGDTTTPWWFPSKTDGGAIRADRIVLPIPPGTRWDDDMPMLLPAAAEEARTLSQPKEERKMAPRPTRRPVVNEQRKSRPVAYFGPPSMTPTPPVEEPKAPKVRAPKPKVKADPKIVSAARELRDRWLEQVNENPSAIASHGKYDVSRAIAAPAPETPTKLLAA